MKNTLRTKEDVMETLTVSGVQASSEISRAAAPGARRGRIAGTAAEVDAQESFVQELLATFGDRWEW